MEDFNKLRKDLEEQIERNLYVPTEIQVERLKICNKCPFFVKSNSRCGKCGCDMNIKTKHKNFKCPDGRF